MLHQVLSDEQVGQINQQLDTGFAYTIRLAFINIVSSQAIQTSTEWEDWHPSLRTNVSPKYDRKYALEALTLSMILSSL